MVKFTKPIAKTKTQLAKLVKIPICYPCIICYSVEHRYGECSKKIEVQIMLRIKFINFNATTTPKLPKHDNVPINVVAIVTSRSQ
jgi:hypothetical protein